MKYLSLIFVFLLAGCVSTQPIPSEGVDFSLDRCPPFLNCVSSESSIVLYKVAPIELVEPVDQARWKVIEQAALGISGATLSQNRFGYLKLTIYSKVFRFPDFFEILISDDSKHLDLRSQSLVGLYDIGVNRRRVEQFRLKLIELGIAR
jgi:uncharacterized protein (DUF1499 family)